MKQAIYDNIRQMDISQGGGIFGEKTRVDIINHPVLVVGLGGTGTDALLRLKYEVNRRFNLPINPTTKQREQKPANIEYLSFETNEHDIKKYKGIGLDAYTESVLLSNAGIGAILNNRSTIPDYIKKWLSPELTITDGTKGASGNRQAGRLLLFEKINTAIDAINNKIKSLRTDHENKLLVFILSGLSGGTGGGMFLDIAYIIRGLMECEYGAKGIDKAEITGYLFTPDIHLAANNINIHTQEYIQRNGYAALKELDYFMNIEERGERFEQQYGTRLTVNSALAPFNLCHLISAANIDGVFLKDAYDFCLNVTAENIVNFLALEAKESGAEFAITDYQSNLISNIAAMKANLPEGMAGAANFVYNIIGASSANLPTEQLNAYIAHALFDEIQPMFEAEPTDHDIQEFANTTGIETAALGGELMRSLPQIKLNYAETDYYSYANVIKTRRVDVGEKLNEQYAAANRALTNGVSKDLTAATVEKLLTELQTAFLDPKRGPVYISRMIESDKNPCLSARFNTYLTRLKEKQEQLKTELDAKTIAAETRLEEAKRAFFFNCESRKNAYIEAKTAECNARLQLDIYTALTEIYKNLRAAVQTENDNRYLPLKEILFELRRVFASNAENILTTTDKHLIEVKHAEAEIKQSIKTIGTETLIRSLAKTFTEGQISISETISNFLFEHAGDILSRTLPAFLTMRYGRERGVENIIEDEVAPQLYRDAKPVFHLDNTMGMFNFPGYGMVSIPENAPEIMRGIGEYQHRALANLRFNIRKSKITDRIFWLNTQNGIPLFAYAPIRVYEELYEKTINTKEGIGRHLAMNENENWLNLPSPIPQKLWGDTYKNPRQQALNEQARALYKTAVSTGIFSPKNFATQEEAENFFIRCPNLIKKAQPITQSVENTAPPEPNHTNDFIEILTFEAIVKRGAHYIYEKPLEDDPWQPFVNLIEHAAYPEHEMYKNYLSLPQKRKQTLQKKAKQNQSRLSAAELLIALQKWQGKIAVRKNQLDTEAQTIKNGKDMYAFYRNSLLRLNSQVAALAGD